MKKNIRKPIKTLTKKGLKNLKGGANIHDDDGFRMASVSPLYEGLGSENSNP